MASKVDMLQKGTTASTKSANLSCKSVLIFLSYELDFLELLFTFYVTLLPYLSLPDMSVSPDLTVPIAVNPDT